MGNRFAQSGADGEKFVGLDGIRGIDGGGMLFRFPVSALDDAAKFGHNISPDLLWFTDCTLQALAAIAKSEIEKLKNSAIRRDMGVDWGIFHLKESRGNCNSIKEASG